MNNAPLVSVIMPVYKVEKYIADSVRSVLCQTYENIELILVDDGTPDNSIEIAKEELTDSRFPFHIIHQDNGGMGSARNAGLRKAQGEWVLFLDSDDLLVEQTIEHLVRAGIENQSDLVFCAFCEILSADEAIRSCQSGDIRVFSAREIQMAFLKRSFVVLAPGTLYKRKMLRDIGLWYEKIPWSEDQHFIWRVLFHVEKAVFVNEPLYQYLHHPGSIMDATKIDAMIESYQSIRGLEAYYADNPIAKYIVPRWVMGTMNSAARIESMAVWMNLFRKINGRRNCISLLDFPDAKVRILAVAGCISASLYYLLIHYVKKR